MSMISLLLYESEAKQGRIFFYRTAAMASCCVHLSKLPLYINKLSFELFSDDIYSSTYCPRTISRYRPVVNDIRFITLQISLMYGFTGK